MPRRNDNKPIVIDLFAGAGGLSLGATRAGFNVACAVEIDQHALETHKKNFPQTLHLDADISSLSGRTLLRQTGMRKGQVDGLIGGPPCQGFSVMGHQSPDDVRNSLFGNFFRLVNEIHPRFFVAENVPGLLCSRFDEIRKQAFSLVQDNYVLMEPLIVTANEYGAPTTRKRVFFIGYERKRFKSVLTSDEFKNMIVSDEEQVRVKQALIGLPPEIPDFAYSETVELDISFRNKDSFTESISGKIPEGVGSAVDVASYLTYKRVSGCIPTFHSQEVKNRYKNLDYGQVDSVSRAVKLNPDGFCPTLRAGTGPDKGSYQAVRPIHYSQPRVITPREAARLQGFPDWFVFHRTKWHSFRQIGNSVSPIVAEKLLSVVYQKIT